MRTYNTPHAYYCGVDLHARTLFVNVLDHAGQTQRGLGPTLGDRCENDPRVLDGFRRQRHHDIRRGTGPRHFRR